MPDGPWPGTGAVLAAIETACSRTADEVVGKPEPAMYDTARDRLGEGRVLASATASTPTSRARARRGSTPRSCSRAPRTPREATGAPSRAPTFVADSLAALCLPREAPPPPDAPQATPRRRATGACSTSWPRTRPSTAWPPAASSRAWAPGGRSRTISKIREIESGLSITINTEGAVIDAYVVTSDPAGVAAWLRDEGLALVIARPSA